MVEAEETHDGSKWNLADHCLLPVKKRAVALLLLPAPCQNPDDRTAKKLSPPREASPSNGGHP
jgi:hypothetical protein